MNAVSRRCQDSALLLLFCMSSENPKHHLAIDTNHLPIPSTGCQCRSQKTVAARITYMYSVVKDDG